MKLTNVVLFSLAWMLALSGCTTEGTSSRPSPSETQAKGLTADPVGEPPDPLTQKIANEEERAAKRAYRTPTGPKIVPVDFEAARSYRQIDAALLTSAAREKLEEVSLPVLLPDDPSLLSTAVITVGAAWYAAGIDGDGISVHIHGTRAAFDVEEERLPEAALDGRDDFILTRTHAIVSISFNAFGAAYSIDVECAAPTEDPRCTEDEYVLGLAESLGVAGGVQ